MEDESLRDEYEIEILEDMSEPFDRLKKWAQKIPNKYKCWRVEVLDTQIILYKLDVSKGAARTPVTIQILQKDTLDIKFYAAESLLNFEDLNSMIGVDIRKFKCQNIDSLVEFFDGHTFIKSEASQPKVLEESEQYQNLALFFNKNVDVCRFCFRLEGKSDAPFHNYTNDLQKTFEELTLLQTKHKKAPNRICPQCTKQLLSSHEARSNFIASDRILQDCTQVLYINNGDGGVSSTQQMLQIKPGTLISTADDSSSSEHQIGSKRKGPSILKPRSQKITRSQK